MSQLDRSEDWRETGTQQLPAAVEDATHAGIADGDPFDMQSTPVFGMRPRLAPALVLVDELDSDWEARELERKAANRAYLLSQSVDNRLLSAVCAEPRLSTNKEIILLGADIIEEVNSYGNSNSRIRALYEGIKRTVGALERSRRSESPAITEELVAHLMAQIFVEHRNDIANLLAILANRGGSTEGFKRVFGVSRAGDIKPLFITASQPKSTVEDGKKVSPSFGKTLIATYFNAETGSQLIRNIDTLLNTKGETKARIDAVQLSQSDDITRRLVAVALLNRVRRLVWFEDDKGFIQTFLRCVNNPDNHSAVQEFERFMGLIREKMPTVDHEERRARAADVTPLETAVPSYAIDWSNIVSQRERDLLSGCIDGEDIVAESEDAAPQPRRSAIAALAAEPIVLYDEPTRETSANEIFEQRATIYLTSVLGEVREQADIVDEITTLREKGREMMVNARLTGIMPAYRIFCQRAANAVNPAYYDIVHTVLDPEGSGDLNSDQSKLVSNNANHSLFSRNPAIVPMDMPEGIPQTELAEREEVSQENADAIYQEAWEYVLQGPSIMSQFSRLLERSTALQEQEGVECVDRFRVFALMNTHPTLRTLVTTVIDPNYRGLDEKDMRIINEFGDIDGSSFAVGTEHLTPLSYAGLPEADEQQAPLVVDRSTREPLPAGRYAQRSSELVDRGRETLSETPPDIVLRPLSTAPTTRTPNVETINSGGIIGALRGLGSRVKGFFGGLFKRT